MSESTFALIFWSACMFLWGLWLPRLWRSLKPVEMTLPRAVEEILRRTGTEHSVVVRKSCCGYNGCGGGPVTCYTAATYDSEAVERVVSGTTLESVIKKACAQWAVKRYCNDPDHCTYSDCPAVFCDRK